MVKVSVILPTYNSGRFLQSTIDSILNQYGINRFFSIELIIIDDCSNDNTIDILKKNNLAYVTNPTNSKGPNKGRNRGLNMASGDLICFIDHDDIWHPHKLFSQVDASRRVPVITTGYRTSSHPITFSMDNTANAHGFIKFGKNQTFLTKLRKDKNGQPTYLSSIMISAELKNVHFEENFGMVDYDWLLRVFENRESIHINKDLVFRQVNGDNLSLNLKYRLIDYHFSLLTLESYQNTYPREVMTARKRINGTRARYHFMQGEMQEARKYFLRSTADLKTISYYLTSFFGSDWVNTNFRVFN